MLTRHEPCRHGGDDGRLSLTDFGQKREEQAVARHGIDNTWQWEHGAQETRRGGWGGGGVEEEDDEEEDKEDLASGLPSLIRTHTVQ